MSDLQKIIQSNAALLSHADSFVLLQAPDGLEGISSTAARERLRAGRNVTEILTHEVYTMLLAERTRE